jgi:hypothetical protein
MSDPEPVPLPSLSRVGILEQAEGLAGTPRVYPRPLRLVALLVLTVFALVVVVTTARSLGAFCLTTDAGSAPARAR